MLSVVAWDGIAVAVRTKAVEIVEDIATPATLFNTRQDCSCFQIEDETIPNDQLPITNFRNFNFRFVGNIARFLGIAGIDQPTSAASATMNHPYISTSFALHSRRDSGSVSQYVVEAVKLNIATNPPPPKGTSFEVKQPRYKHARAREIAVAGWDLAKYWNWDIYATVESAESAVAVGICFP